MGRKAVIQTEKLIQLVDRYFAEECNGNAALLKVPSIAEYARKNGYPGLNDFIVRRNKEVRDHIDSIKKMTEESNYDVAVTYHTLDVNNFLEVNSSPEKLKKALRQRDMYYKQIALSAIHFKEKAVKLEDRIRRILADFEMVKTEKHILERINEENRSQIEELLNETKKLKEILDTYVYPEIANELLKKNGILKNTANLIDNKQLDQKIIRPETKIKANNNLIQGLFDKLEQ